MVIIYVFITTSAFKSLSPFNCFSLSTDKQMADNYLHQNLSSVTYPTSSFNSPINQPITAFNTCNWTLAVLGVTVL